jgi:hypothetical protein
LTLVATESRIRAGADAAMGYPHFGMIGLLKLLGGLLVGLFRSRAAREAEMASSPPAACCPAAVRAGEAQAAHCRSPDLRLALSRDNPLWGCATHTWRVAESWFRHRPVDCPDQNRGRRTGPQACRHDGATSNTSDRAWKGIADTCAAGSSGPTPPGCASACSSTTRSARLGVVFCEFSEEFGARLVVEASQTGAVEIGYEKMTR